MLTLRSLYCSFLVFFALTSAIVSVRADEFKDALEVALREARIQEVYYENLLELQTQSHCELIDQKICPPSYPGIPNHISPALSSPWVSMTISDQSRLFWKIAHYQLENFLKIYSKLPDGACKTSPVQAYLLETLNEFNFASIAAFNDIKSNFSTLYNHLTLSPDSVKFQYLKWMPYLLEEVSKKLSKKKNNHPHWSIDLVQFASPRESFSCNTGYQAVLDVLFDQFIYDFQNNLNFLKYFRKYYQGDSRNILDQENHYYAPTKRWIDQILNHYEHHIITHCNFYKNQRNWKKDRRFYLPAEEGTNKVVQTIMHQNISELFDQVWKKKSVIEEELQFLRQKEEESLIPASVTVQLEAIPSVSSAAQIIAPSLAIDTPRATTETVSTKKNELKDLTDSASLAIEANDKDGVLDEEELSSVMSYEDYALIARAEHERIQLQKLATKTTTYEPPKIFLERENYRIYQTIMGQDQCKVRNREVRQLVRALGGKIVQFTGDSRIVIPNRSTTATQPFYEFKMHFRHDGKEEFPVGTLRGFFGRAIQQANLNPFVTQK